MSRIHDNLDWHLDIVIALCYLHDSQNLDPENIHLRDSLKKTLINVVDSLIGLNNVNR